MLEAVALHHSQFNVDCADLSILIEENREVKKERSKLVGSLGYQLIYEVLGSRVEIFFLPDFYYCRIR